MTAVVTFALFLLFATGLWFGAMRTLFRIYRYRRMGWKYPELIWRDITVQGGFAVTVALLTIARLLVALGVSQAFRGQLWWIVLTMVPALIAVWVYAYYEVFRLDKINGEEK